MGFGGSGSMNVVLKNDKKLLNTREKFKKTLGGYGKGRKTEYDFPKAQPHVLRRLKERMKHENEQILKRRIIAFIAVSIMLITGLLYII